MIIFQIIYIFGIHWIFNIKLIFLNGSVRRSVIKSCLAPKTDRNNDLLPKSSNIVILYFCPYLGYLHNYIVVCYSCYPH